MFVNGSKFPEYIFNYHPEYKDNVKKYYDRYLPYHIEGGDVLNLNEHILAVGISQRTEAGAIDQLAKNIFKNPNSNIDTILAFNIPSKRAFMHLDTVFTQIDYDKFTYHPGIMDTLQVFEITEGDIPDSDEDLNVKEVKFIKDVENYMNFTVKPNFKEVGKVFGPKIKLFSEELLKLSTSDVTTLQNGGIITMTLDGEEYEITE